MGADAQGGLFAAFQAPEPGVGASATGSPAAHSPTPPGTENAPAPMPKPQGAASALGSPLAPQQSFQTAELSTIRRGLDQGKVQPLIDRAESDQDIARIRREMEKRGLNIPPQLMEPM